MIQKFGKALYPLIVSHRQKFKYKTLHFDQFDDISYMGWTLTLPQSLTLLLTQRTMGMPRGVLLGTVESCVEKLAE